MRASLRCGVLSAALLPGLFAPGGAPAQGAAPAATLRGAPTAPGSVQPRLRSGNWQLGVAVEITPRGAGPATGPMETTRCLGPRQVDELMAAAPGAACVPQVSRFTPDVIEWRHSCRHGPTVAVAQGRIDFRDTRLEGTIVTTSPDSDLRITTRIAGRYLGACIDTRGAAGPNPVAPGATIEPPRPGERLPRYITP